MQKKDIPRDVNTSVLSKPSLWRSILILLGILLFIFAICFAFYSLPYVLQKLYTTHVAALFRLVGEIGNRMHALAETHNYDSVPPELIDDYTRLADEYINRLRLIRVRFKLAIVPPKYRDVHKMCLEYIDVSTRTYNLFKQYLRDPNNHQLRLMLDELSYYLDGLAHEISFTLSY